MKKIFNELGVSLVVGPGNWIGFSNEIEDGEKEVRTYGWEKIKVKDINDLYIRIWLLKRVLVFSSKNGIKLKLKNKYGFKIILGFSN
ncbi:MAG: DUF3977 family protein [Candidatus Gracilibacteria bacterium]|nr:DUF3977 family protein [Candidatus Gracilibacteria bacterium]